MQEELLRQILNNHKYPEMEKSGAVVPEEAHFNLKEVELLNSLQGKEIRLSDHGNIRSFMPLAELFFDPTYLRLVNQIKENLEEHQVEDHEIENALDEFIEENKDKTTMQPESPMIAMEAAEGMGGDTEICLCPSNMLDFFDEMRGFSSVNPNDGKRQYFIPILGAIIGGLVGSSAAGALGAGVIGGALATAAGAGLGSMVFGGKPKDALKYAAIGGLGSVAAPYLDNMLGGSGGIGGLFGGGAGATTATNAINASPQAAQAVGAETSNAATGAGGGWLGSMTESLFSAKTLIPTALIGGMLYKANQDNLKLQNQYKQEMGAYNQHHERFAGGLKDHFSNVDVSLHKEPQRDFTSGYQTEIGTARGMSPIYGTPTGQYYAGGGQIETDKSGGIDGDGKGQDDDIHDDYEVGDYMQPADIVSGLGDGNTQAGFDQLDKLEDYILKNKDIHEAYEKVPEKVKAELGKKQPVAVSSGEYLHDKNITVAVGDGSLKKADAIFQQFYKLVRDDKRTDGNTIPKKAKSAIEYFKEAQRKVNKRMGS